MKTGPNPYLTCSHPLMDGLKAQPKLFAMLTRLATVARAPPPPVP